MSVMALIPQNIESKHIIQAIEEIKNSKIPTRRDSTRFYISYKGEYYPPKLVLSIANKLVNGKELESSEFSGEDGTNDFLKKRGFEVIEESAGGGCLD
jgi:5-methylcytosine-specific restriction protein B